jgi:hypothetical protein
MPKYVNEGPPQFVVELQREVEQGETFKGSDALAAVHGFVPVEDPKKKPAKDEE